MLRLAKGIIFFLILAIGFLIFLKSLEYYSPDFTKGYLADKKDFFDGFFKFGLYSHIVSTPVVLLIGGIQFFFRYEIRYKKIHTFLGKIYVFLIFFLAAPGAFILSFFAFGGWVSQISFLLLIFFWIWFTWQAYKSAIQKEISKHRRNITRSYLLTLSAVFLRILSFIFIHYFQYSGKDAYALISWLSWMPSLVILEVYYKSKGYSTLSK